MPRVHFPQKSAVYIIYIYTVIHKKHGSTFVIITLENLDAFE